MDRKSGNLLADAGRPFEKALGAACGFISTVIAGFTLWLLYLVAWRNPREHDVHALGRPETIAILFTQFVISFGFAVMASRLLRGEAAKGLLSPMALRVWGSFFAAASIIALAADLVTGNWPAIVEKAGLVSSTMGMTVAAFVMARRRSALNARTKAD